MLDLNSLNSFLNNPTNQLILLLLTVWSLVWKGVALWGSAKNNQRNWFIVLLVLNTFGILEIIYIFYFNKPKAPKTQNTSDGKMNN